MFKDFDVWKFPIIPVNTSMFNNTRLGHCRLLHICYLGALGLSFSTHSRILFSSEYFRYKIFTSRGPVPGRGPAVEKQCTRVLWLLELQIRYGGKVQTQVRNENFNSRTSNCHCSLFSKKNPTTRICCISGCFAVPIIPDKWSSTVPVFFFKKGLIALTVHTNKQRYVQLFLTPNWELWFALVSRAGDTHNKDNITTEPEDAMLADQHQTFDTPSTR
jgi:hypothetical protein